MKKYKGRIYDIKALEFSLLSSLSITMPWHIPSEQISAPGVHFKATKSNSMEWQVQLEIPEKNLMILKWEQQNLSHNFWIFTQLIILKYQSTLLWIFYNSLQWNTKTWKKNHMMQTLLSVQIILWADNVCMRHNCLEVVNHQLNWPTLVVFI